MTGPQVDASLILELFLLGYRGNENTTPKVAAELLVECLDKAGWALAPKRGSADPSPPEWLEQGAPDRPSISDVMRVHNENPAFPIDAVEPISGTLEIIIRGDTKWLTANNNRSYAIGSERFLYAAPAGAQKPDAIFAVLGGLFHIVWTEHSPPGRSAEFDTTKLTLKFAPFAMLEKS